MKTLTLKRIASLALVCVLALSLAAPSFAAGFSTKVTGTYTEIPLKVVVPSAIDAVINPLGMPYELDATTKVSVLGQQIASPTSFILNKSEVDLDVSAEVTMEVANGMYLVNDLSSSDAKTEPNKLLTITLEAFEDEKFDKTAFSSDGKKVADNDPSGVHKEFAKLDATKAAFTITPGSAQASYDATDVKKAGGGNGALVLKKADSDGEVQAGGVAFFRLTGVVAQQPEWAEGGADYFLANIAWSFTPFIYEDGGALTASAGTDLSSGTQTTDVSLTVPGGKNLKTGTTVDWVSSDPAVATVADNSSATTSVKGTVTYQGAGTCTITAYFINEDGVRYASQALEINCT